MAAAVVGVAAAVAAVALRLWALEESAAVPGWTLSNSNVVIGSTWALAGLALVRADPRNRCGWLLLATAWLSVYQLLGEYSIWSAYVAPLPGHEVSDWVSSWGFVAYFVVLPLVPLTFPDGRLPSPRWRWLVRTVLGAAALALVARMFVEGSTDIDSGVVNPIGFLPEVANAGVLVAAVWCNTVGVPAAVVAVVLRMRRAVGIERIQLQWLLLGGLTVVLGLVLTIAADSDLAFTLGLLGPPVAVALSVLRHRVVDVDLALNRALVFTGVVAVIGAGGTWLLLQLDAELAGTRQGVLLVAGLAVAMVLAQGVVQRVIDRRWFPQREADGVLQRRIVEAVSEASEPQAALDELVRAVCGTLRLPYVGFADPAGRALSRAGQRPAHVVAVDALALGRVVGVLEVAPRREGEGFGATERRVLEESAAQAGMLAYAGQLVADVAHSRASIVSAREEERRRLRNDLHDGVGPSLAALALQADVLAKRLRAHDAAEADLAGELRDRLRASVAEVRAVSHGLRPPILDQIGLSAALRQLVDGLGPVHGQAQVDDLGDLPAASEVAAYVIAAEAVHNVVRHSAASRVRLDAAHIDGALRLVVADNGRGMPAHPRAGVGLASMRQRAVEVGGTLDHRAAPGGGTLVVLDLPLDPSYASPEQP